MKNDEKGQGQSTGELDNSSSLRSELETVRSNLRWAQESQAFAVRILALLNRQIESADAIREILGMVKEFTGFEAVGIRLREGEDFPYFETKGFPGYFVEAEYSLCSRTEDGEVVRDSIGNAVLECMCGNVIRGRTNPSLPFFTEGGSFWTNSTTELLISTTEEDRQARTRNRCNGEGYESVALIPLKSDRETLGLLQLNDSRKNCFTSDMIIFFEGLGASIGIVLARARVEEVLRESEKKFRDLFNNAGVGMFRSRLDGSETLDVNDKFLKILNQSREGVIGKPSVMLCADPREWEEMVRRLKIEGQVTDFEYRMLTAQGEVRNCLTSVRLYPENEILEGTILDITDRKKAEEKLRDSEERYRAFFETSRDSVFMTRLDGQFVDFNDVALARSSTSNRRVSG